MVLWWVVLYCLCLLWRCLSSLQHNGTRVNLTCDRDVVSHLTGRGLEEGLLSSLMHQRKHVSTYDWPVRLNNITAQSWRTKCVDILPRCEQIHVFLGPLSSTGIISPKNASGFLWVTSTNLKSVFLNLFWKESSDSMHSTASITLEERHLLCLMV